MSETPKKITGAGRLPGDPAPAELVARAIRVDQAGEYGAKRIYDGQLAVLARRGDAESHALIRNMALQEQAHLDAFDRMLVERRVRPTLLSPVWHVAGFALGAASALLGVKAAMACTEAVEEVIDEHYARQAASLGDDEADLKRTIEQFRADEVGHRDTARASGAAGAPAYNVLKPAVKAASRLAIWLSERV
jgi:3-demethoxyubiquinol 3-hydroxylase